MYKRQVLSHLEKAHYRKIDISDGIYVVNIGGYIGESVKAEIQYAKEKIGRASCRERVCQYV